MTAVPLLLWLYLPVALLFTAGLFTLSAYNLQLWRQGGSFPHMLLALLLPVSAVIGSVAVFLFPFAWVAGIVLASTAWALADHLNGSGHLAVRSLRFLKRYVPILLVLCLLVSAASVGLADFWQQRQSSRAQAGLDSAAAVIGKDLSRLAALKATLGSDPQVLGALGGTYSGNLQTYLQQVGLAQNAPYLLIADLNGLVLGRSYRSAAGDSLFTSLSWTEPLRGSPADLSGIATSEQGQPIVAAAFALQKNAKVIGYAVAGTPLTADYARTLLPAGLPALAVISATDVICTASQSGQDAAAALVGSSAVVSLAAAGSADRLVLGDTILAALSSRSLPSLPANRPFRLVGVSTVLPLSVSALRSQYGP